MERWEGEGWVKLRGRAVTPPVDVPLVNPLPPRRALATREVTAFGEGRLMALVANLAGDWPAVVPRPGLVMLPVLGWGWRATEAC